MILVITCQNYKEKLSIKLKNLRNLKISSPIQIEANIETKPVQISKFIPFLDNSNLVEKDSFKKTSESHFSIDDEI